MKLTAVNKLFLHMRLEMMDTAVEWREGDRFKIFEIDKT